MCACAKLHTLSGWPIYLSRAHIWPALREFPNSAALHLSEWKVGPCMVCSKQIESAHSSTSPTKAKVSSRSTARFTSGISGLQSDPQAMHWRPYLRWPVTIVTAVPRICASKLEKLLWHEWPKWLYAERARPVFVGKHVLSVQATSAWPGGATQPIRLP